MENYTKGETIERPLNARSHFLHILFDRADVVEAFVKPNTREREAARHVVDSLSPKKLEAVDVGPAGTTPATNYAVIYGVGTAIKQTVAVVEMIKKDLPDLYQLNRIKYARVLESWQPKLEGLETLQVTRNTPALFVLLSKIPLPDPTEQGYQQSLTASRVSGRNNIMHPRQKNTSFAEEEYFPHGRRTAHSYQPASDNNAAIRRRGGRRRKKDFGAETTSNRVPLVAHRQPDSADAANNNKRQDI